jgi:hypothetical protein
MSANPVLIGIGGSTTINVNKAPVCPRWQLTRKAGSSELQAQAPDTFDDTRDFNQNLNQWNNLQTQLNQGDFATAALKPKIRRTPARKTECRQ